MKQLKEMYFANEWRIHALLLGGVLGTGIGLAGFAFILMFF